MRKTLHPRRCVGQDVEPNPPTGRFPSRREIRAVELGADELIARAEWHFRARPQVLRNLRSAYRRFCSFILDKIERGS